MISQPYSRRQWFKTSLGLIAASGMSYTIQAEEIKYSNRVHPYTGRWMFDESKFVVPVKARLNSNENPYGPSEKAKTAIIEGFKDANRYSEPVVAKFKSAIAAKEGVKEDQIFLCAGLSELLTLLGDLTGLQHGNMISAHPTFDLMPALAADTGGKWIQVPLNDQHQHDLRQMELSITDQTKLVYICNPGNPVPTIVNPAELSSFCDRISRRTLILIDEAYNDYIPLPSNHTMVSKVKEGKQVIIGRTFSKVHGFAGLRMAYALAPANIIDQLEKYRTWNYSMGVHTMYGAMASMQDEVFQKNVVQKTILTRNNTVATLRSMGYEPTSSFTNFIIFPIRMDGKELVTKMRDRGVALKSWAFDDKQWCRVSIGTDEEMGMFLDAMKELS